MPRGHYHISHSKYHSSSNRKDGTDGKRTNQRGSKPQEKFDQFWFCHMCGDGPMTTEIVLVCPEFSCNHQRCEECTVQLYRFSRHGNLWPSTSPNPDISPQSKSQPVVVDLDEDPPSLLVQKSSGSDNSPKKLLVNKDNYTDCGNDLAKAQGKNGKLPPSFSQALTIRVLSSTTETLKAALSLPLIAVQVANSTVAVLDPIWTKASIVCVAATAIATVAINGVNANTARRVADINERSVAIAGRAANASEQNALTALSAAETAARRLAFDQEESLKEKEKEVGKSDSTTIKGDGNGEASNSTAQSKRLLPISVSAKPSSTQTRLDADIRARYKERERKKQEETEKKARNIQIFKKLLQEPFNGVSSAKENELDGRLRELRNRQYEHGEGVKESESESDREDSRWKGKGKERDMGRVYSSSSTPGCADMGGEGDGESEEGVPGQGPSTGLPTSTSILGFGEVGYPSVKEALRSPLSQPSIFPAALTPKLTNAGKQDFYQSESRASLHRSVNLTEREDSYLDTLPLSSANGTSPSSPDYAVAEIHLETPSPTESAALVNETPTSKPGVPPTAINAPSLEVVEGREQRKEVVTIKITSGEVTSKGGQDATSWLPPKQT
ncbi:uncharacterized protein LY89DRAFT_675953 [Mollisia scopiformis]|uniref:Uncharacterized protein n=1 Tax=Mollisia scopiformis TaxID=149040 RepID=A0A132BBK0_MOLSC|nr:uncharacterized protein LY89DRAFT_675953 [Mollisia scopiformis]KUJ09802.1 hypothetical protein LY89DRAFT_675953 [Mollisia scopiformis]